jgi:hypothetical protein
MVFSATAEGKNNISEIEQLLQSEILFYKL